MCLSQNKYSTWKILFVCFFKENKSVIVLFTRVNEIGSKK